MPSYIQNEALKYIFLAILLECFLTRSDNSQTEACSSACVFNEIKETMDLYFLGDLIRFVHYKQLILVSLHFIFAALKEGSKAFGAEVFSMRQ